jgi:diguanylate cyclase (GGDEF)-like protein
MTPGANLPGWRRRTDWVLGVQRSVRMRVAFQLLAWAVYLGCDAAVLLGMHLNVVDRSLGWAFIGITLAAQVLFYLLLRSGWSQRRPDPSLMIEQSVLALTLVAVGYAMAGPLRYCTLMLSVLVIVYAMFSLTSRQTMALGLYAVASVGCAMFVMARLQPLRYPPQEELLLFAVVAATLPVVSLLARYVSQLRERLKREQQELRDALACAHELATRDLLTGLVNRKNMGELLAMALRREAQNGTAFSIALADIDGLHKVNEAHGEDIGDEALRNFSRAIKKTLRQSDVVARWGGDEFLVLLNETPHEYALMGLRRLREEVAGHSPVPHLPALRVTFSAGLVAHRHGDTLIRTLERAEHSLQAAKDQGRGGLVLADADTGPRVDRPMPPAGGEP